LVAILLCVGARTPVSVVFENDQPVRMPGRVTFLSLGLMIGLLPFKAMGRPTTLLEYGSRFRIPILPLAVTLTVALSLCLVRRKARWVAVATFGFLIGYSSWNFAYVAIQKHRTISAYGQALAPYVARTEGNTVAVVSMDRFESELTATTTLDWPVNLEKKMWVVGEGPGRKLFGNREACLLDPVLNVRMRGLTRLGKIDELLWVESEPGKPIIVEQYCWGTDEKQALLAR
jgi:hypothetical protein